MAPKMVTTRSKVPFSMPARSLASPSRNRQLARPAACARALPASTRLRAMSTPRTSAPSLAAGSAVVPSPQPRSSTSSPLVMPSSLTSASPLSRMLAAIRVKSPFSQSALFGFIGPVPSVDAHDELLTRWCDGDLPQTFPRRRPLSDDDRRTSDDVRRHHDVDAGGTGAEARREPAGEQRVLSSGLHITQRAQKHAAVVGRGAATQSMRVRRRVDRHVHDMQRREVGARLEYPIDVNALLGQCPGLV